MNLSKPDSEMTEAQRRRKWDIEDAVRILEKHEEISTDKRRT